ncbi:MAG: DUF924 domain-containing protein, partial [Alphaproteobacteria bacterium]|nr:DUF924 domain-containing protein [Alphaproteobacteria bacterium]
MTETIDSVLEFWFGRGKTAAEVYAEKKEFWFSKNDELDREITARFAPLVDAVAAGGRSEWEASPRGQLALILCTDQFPRNMHRGSPKAFAHDHIALGYAKQCDAAQLRPIERMFAYLPFEHSEDLAEQSRSVALFKKLTDETQPPDRAVFAEILDFAQRHYDIIERFGRFPHRNAALGRETSAEAVSYTHL